MNAFIKRFHREEIGAVTVDWVVLTAGVIGLAIVAFAAIESVTDEPVVAAMQTLNSADAVSDPIALP